MRVSTSKVVLAVLVVGLWSPDASAQVSKADNQMKKVKELADDLSRLCGRRDPDEAAIKRTTKELSEACKSASDTLEHLFEKLAAEDSGEHKTRLEELSKHAKLLAKEVVERELIKRCSEVTKLIDERKDRGEQFRRDLDFAMTQASVGGGGLATFHWVKLKEKSEETLTWLRKSLNDAQTLRENSAKPWAELNAAKKKIETTMNEKGEEYWRHNKALKDCETSEAVASRKCAEAVAAHEVVRKTPGSPSYTITIQKWAAAEKEHKDAIKRTNDAFANKVKALAEYNARRAELTKLMEDIEKFAREADPATIDKRCADFARWTSLLHGELKP